MATTSPIPVIPTEAGFPAFTDTNWGDLIAAAQPPAGKPSAANVDANGTKAGIDGEGDAIKVARKLGQGRDKERGAVRSGARANGAHGHASSTLRFCRAALQGRAPTLTVRLCGEARQGKDRVLESCLYIARI